MRQKMLGNKSKAGTLYEVVHGVLSNRNLGGALIIGEMVLAACVYVPATGTSQNATPTPLQPAVSKTMSVTMTPVKTVTVTPTEEATVTATKVTVRTEFARGEVMTPEEIKVNVDWYYNLSDEELNKLTWGKLWSFSKYRGDSRPRDIDGNVLSETQDLGYICAIEKKDEDFSTPIEFYNVVFLGLTKIKDENGIEYFVGALGMKDAKGEKMVVYGGYDLVESGRMGGAIFRSSLYDGVRYFGSYIGEIVDKDGYVQKLLNGQTKKVVLLEMGRVIKYSSFPLPDEVILLEELKGDEALYEMLKIQYAGGAESPRAFFEEILGAGGTLPLEHTKESIVKLVVSHRE